MGGFGVGGMVFCGFGVDWEFGVDEGGSDGEWWLVVVLLVVWLVFVVVGGWSGFSGF